VIAAKIRSLSMAFWNAMAANGKTSKDGFAPAARLLSIGEKGWGSACDASPPGYSQQRRQPLSATTFILQEWWSDLKSGEYALAAAFGRDSAPISTAAMDLSVIAFLGLLVAGSLRIVGCKFRAPSAGDDRARPRLTGQVSRWSLHTAGSPTRRRAGSGLLGVRLSPYWQRHVCDFRPRMRALVFARSESLERQVMDSACWG
jgi:hypothetical protein